MAGPRVDITFSGNGRGAIAAAREVAESVEGVKRTVRGSAQANVQAAARERAGLEKLAREYRQLANAAQKGSREQVAAALLATRAESKLGLEVSETGRRVRAAHGEFGKLSRGALAGSGAFRGFARSIAFASSSFLGGAGLIYGLRSAKDAASNLIEQQAKSDVVFGRSAASVKRWADTTAGAYNIARDQALEYAGTFGNLFRVTGLTSDASSKMSRSLVQLAADAASFNNVPLEESLEAIRSGIVGETEPMRRLGVLLSEARVQEMAYAKGIAERGAKLTEAQKVEARYAVILKDLALARGDVARTSESQANQERELAKNVRNTLAIGQALLPTINEITKAINEWLGKSENQERVQREVTKAVEGFTSGVREAWPVVKTLAGVVRSAVDAVGGLENALKLLLLLKVGVTVGRWAGALQNLAGPAGAGGATRAIAGKGGLAAVLRALPRSVPIQVTVTVIGLALLAEASRRIAKLVDQATTDTARTDLSDLGKAKPRGTEVATIPQGTRIKFDPRTGEFRKVFKDMDIGAVSAEKAAKLLGITLDALAKKAAALTKAYKENAAAAAAAFSATTAVTGSGKAQTAVKYATAQQGVPYDWGGGGTAAGPTHGSPGGPHFGTGVPGFDCSGLIASAYAQVGITLPRTSQGMAKAGMPIGMNQLAPGDILVVNGGKHVIMYVGNGQVVAASSASGKVVLQPLSIWKGRIVAARRIIPETESGATEAAKKAAASKKVPKGGGGGGVGQISSAQIAQAAAATGLAPELIAAVLKQESGGKQSARSPAGAVGVMQLMAPKGIAAEKSAAGAAANLMQGARYLAEMLNKYGSIELALIAYNWGPGNLDKYLKSHGGRVNLKDLPKETQGYLKKVGDLQSQFAGDWRAAPTDPTKPTTTTKPRAARESPLIPLRLQRGLSRAEAKGGQDEIDAIKEILAHLNAQLKKAIKGHKTEREIEIRDAIKGLKADVENLVQEQAEAERKIAERLRTRVAAAVRREPRRDSHLPSEERAIDEWRRREESAFQRAARAAGQTVLKAGRELRKQMVEALSGGKEAAPVTPLNQLLPLIDAALEKVKRLMRTKSKAGVDAAIAEYNRLAAQAAPSMEAWATAAQAAQDRFGTAFGRLSSRILGGFDRQTARGLALIRKNIEGQVRAIQAAGQALTSGEGALAAFRSGRSEAALAKRMAEIQKRIREAETPEDRAAAQEELNELLLDQQESALEKQAQAEREARDRSTEEAVRALEEQGAAMESEYQDMRDAHRQALEDMLAQWQVWLSDGTKTVSEFTAWLKGEGLGGGLLEGAGLESPIKAFEEGGKEAGSAFANAFVAELVAAAEAVAALATGGDPAAAQEDRRRRQAAPPVQGQRSARGDSMDRDVAEEDATAYHQVQTDVQSEALITRQVSRALDYAAHLKEEENFLSAWTILQDTVLETLKARWAAYREELKAKAAELALDQVWLDAWAKVGSNAGGAFAVAFVNRLKGAYAALKLLEQGKEPITAGAPQSAFVPEDPLYKPPRPGGGRPFAQGGLVDGVYTGQPDTVDAQLTVGEAVLPRVLVQQLQAVLRAAPARSGRDQVQRFQFGGPVLPRQVRRSDTLMASERTRPVVEHSEVHRHYNVNVNHPHFLGTDDRQAVKNLAHTIDAEIRRFTR